MAARVVEDMVGRKIEMMYPKVQLPVGAGGPAGGGASRCLRASPAGTSSSDLSFNLRAGEILGLGGLVGSGRSELVNAIFGSHRRSAGRFFLDGKPVSLDSPRDAIRCRMGLLTEDRRVTGFVGTMNIRENIVPGQLPQDLRAAFHPPEARSERKCRSYFGQLNIKAPGIETAMLLHSERRQPAEGGAGQVADDRRAHPVPGRAHARHRRRGQGGRSTTMMTELARKRRGHRDDLLGAAGAAGHVRPLRRAAQGSHPAGTSSCEEISDSLFMRRPRACFERIDTGATPGMADRDW